MSKGEAKGKIVPIRFTKAEVEQLNEAAKRNGLTLSEWIRHKALVCLEASISVKCLNTE